MIVTGRNNKDIPDPDHKEKLDRLMKKLNEHFTTKNNDISLQDMLDVFGLGDVYEKQGSNYIKKEKKKEANS